MKIQGSKIANSIDVEYRTKERIFRRMYCEKCKNRDTNLCEIRTALDRQLKCVYYEKEEK